MDNATHRRLMVHLVQEQVPDSVLIADILEPPKSVFARGGGLYGLIGLLFAWKDANRAGGLPPFVLVGVTDEHVYFFKVERAISGWTVRYLIRQWSRDRFPLVSSTPNPATLTIVFGTDSLAQEVRLSSGAGTGAVAGELVSILRAGEQDG